MKITGARMSDDVRVTNHGSQTTQWDVEYESGGQAKVFRVQCGLNPAGRFYLSCTRKDTDRVIPELRKHELFLRMRVSIAAGYLLNLVHELGDDAVRQAFEEAVVKSVLSE